MTFDLNAAVAAWRRTLEHRKGLPREDLDELECHLRDFVEARLGRGWDEESAYRAGVERFGNQEEVASEYRKVFWPKARHRRTVTRNVVISIDMFGSYLKVAVRNMRRAMGYTFINVFGLAVGLACCLLILLFVRDERSYDRYHAHADRAYRVVRSWYDASGEPTLQLARISAPIGPALEAEMPQIERAARVVQTGTLVNYRDRYFDEDRIFFVEPDLLHILTVPFVAGDPGSALVEPNTVVITESMARKYFGAEDPLDKVLRFNNDTDLTVTGVVEDAPPQTHFHYDFLASYATIVDAGWYRRSMQTWRGYNNFVTYVLLAPSADPRAVEAAFPAFLERHYQDQDGGKPRLNLQALPDIHLHSHLDAEIEPNGDVENVYLFSAIAFFILLIACFNFVNLSTARATRRAKEVGMRKALGADRRRLVYQFLGESLLVAGLALAVAVVLAWFALPAFNHLSGKALDLFGRHAFFALGSLTGLALLAGLGAGSYPAFFLSAFRPAAVLKGATGGSWRTRFRSVLVVAQFTVSIVLLIGMVVIFRQLDYVQSRPLGFDASQLVVLPTTQAMRDDFEAMRDRLVGHAGIEAVTASEFIPSDQLLNTTDVAAEVNGQLRTFEGLSLLAVDHDFTDAYDIDLVAGRTFSTDVVSDSTEAFLLNERAVAELGWASPRDAVGKTFILGGMDGERRGRVIGVMKDIHFESMRERITPLIAYVRPELFWNVTVRIDAQQMPQALSFLEDQWAAFRPNFPFQYAFVDQRFARLYQAERRTGRIFTYFAGLAVLIACLGLFGLATFATEQRTKEIGVRKVLGASSGRLMASLTGDFARLVGLAFVVACPVAYLVMDRWLDTFAYRVAMSWWIFVLTGLTAMLVAVLTVSYQAVRAALTNPVEALRYE